MKEKKKVQEIVILSVLLLALIIVVITQLSGKKTTPPAPAATPQTAENAAGAIPVAGAPAEKPGASDLDWVGNDEQLHRQVYAVSTGRDPFYNYLIPPESKPSVIEMPKPPMTTNPQPLPGPGTLIPSGGEKLGTSKTSEVKPEPIELAVPKFTLSGILSVDAKTYAAMIVDGRYVTIREGETIPGVGWTVHKITTTTVYLRKGTQAVSIRLSGGSPK